jgi:hypothetical protein
MANGGKCFFMCHWYVFGKMPIHILCLSILKLSCLFIINDCLFWSFAHARHTYTLPLSYTLSPFYWIVRDLHTLNTSSFSDTWFTKNFLPPWVVFSLHGVFWYIITLMNIEVQFTYFSATLVLVLCLRNHCLI